MVTKLYPYLNFKDTTREAMEFYHSVFGGNLHFTTYKEFNASQDPSEDQKIMNAMLETANGLTLMAADTPNRMEYHAGTNFSISLSGDNDAELTGYYQKLSVGGTVVMPLEKAVWGDKFGLFVDKFGISWMVDITPNAAQFTGVTHEPE